MAAPVLFAHAVVTETETGRMISPSCNVNSRRSYLRARADCNPRFNVSCSNQETLMGEAYFANLEQFTLRLAISVDFPKFNIFSSTNDGGKQFTYGGLISDVTHQPVDVPVGTRTCRVPKVRTH